MKTAQLDLRPQSSLVRASRIFGSVVESSVKWWRIPVVRKFELESPGSGGLGCCGTGRSRSWFEDTSLFTFFSNPWQKTNKKSKMAWLKPILLNRWRLTNLSYPTILKSSYGYTIRKQSAYKHQLQWMTGECFSLTRVIKSFDYSPDEVKCKVIKISSSMWKTATQLNK